MGVVEQQESRLAKGYLVEINEREQEGIRRFLELPFLSTGFFSSLGLDPSFAWYFLEIRADRLGEFEGDVDILAGHLSWRDPNAFESLTAIEAKMAPNSHPSWHSNIAARRLAVEGGIKWPPSTDYLIGIEAKCAYLSPEAEQISEQAIKSKKSSPQRTFHLREQVERLMMMGFDKVALLDMIATPPASGRDIHAWFEASYTALQAHDAMEATLKMRLPDDSSAAHWVWPIGSVIGGDESRRGAGAPIELRSGHMNPYLQKDTAVQKRRQQMKNRLDDILKGLPPPLSFPVIVVDCRPCRKIHNLGDPCFTTERSAKG